MPSIICLSVPGRGPFSCLFSLWHLGAAPSPLPAAAGEDDRILGLSYLGFCSGGVGLRSAAKIEPMAWHRHGKALGSFPGWNSKCRVCPEEGASWAAGPSRGSAVEAD